MSALAPRTDNARGIGLMLASQGLFVVNDTLTKACAAELPTGEIIAVRGLFATLLLLPIVLSQGALRHLGSTYSRPLFVRNASEAFSVLLYLSALLRLPLANVISILQTAPLMLTGAAALWLGERVGWRRWLAASVGLAGILLIVKPGTAQFSWWYVVGFLGVVLAAVRDLATRSLPRTTPNLLVAFLTAVVVALAGCGLGLFELWQWPSDSSFGRLLAAAVFLVTGYNALIAALRMGEIAAVVPFRHAAVLFGLMLGYGAFGEAPDGWALAGSAIVVGAGLYTLFRERRHPEPAQAMERSSAV